MESTPFPPPQFPPPPAHIRGGAHAELVAPNTVTFVLNAPYKPFASVVGDFNAWNTLAHPMQHNGAGLWWTTIPHPGATRYGYYVAVDPGAHVWVGDPYASAVQWSDQGAWAELPPPTPAFAWTDGAWRTPPLRELVIYELCVRDFGGAWQGNQPRYGTFADVEQRLDELVELGVNAIELMPVQAFPGDSSWGYNPVYFHAPASSYGSPDDLRRLVDAAHRRGLAILLDVAFNHAWGEHPWYRMYPPMYGPQGEWLANYNPFFHQTPRAINSWGGVDFDHFVAPTTAYFQDVVRHWLHEYHIDGFRFDWSCGVDYDHREPMRPGCHPYHGIAAIAWAARQAKPDCILIGEYWQLEGTHPEKTAARLLAETELDAVWNGNFHHVLEGVINQRWQWERGDLAGALGGYGALGMQTSTQLINYTCSHDEVRPEHEIHYYTGRWIERASGMSLSGLALARARLGLVALFAGAGVPMVYSGQEYGERSPRTVDFLPLNRSLRTRPLNAVHETVVRRLIRARRSHPALRSDAIAFDPAPLAESKLLRFWRWEEGSGADAAAVALNFAPVARTIELHLPYGGRWRDVVSDTVVEVAAGPISPRLEAYGACLFVPETE